MTRAQTFAFALALTLAGCGSGGAGGVALADDEVCAFDGSSGALRVQSNSSNGHDSRDLRVDLATGHLTGRVSSVGPNDQHQVRTIDETMRPDDLSRLRSTLRATCGEPSSAEAGPDDMGGGTTTYTVEIPGRGDIVLLGEGLNHTLAAGTRVLIVSRDTLRQITLAFSLSGL